MYISAGDRPAVDEGRPPSGARVPSTVVLLGVVSLLTDVSSEAVNAVLPLYLTAVLGLSPVAYGVVDGLYQGVSATVRILGGWTADRWDRPKWAAAAGYALSAASRVLLLPAHGFAAIAGVISLDRIGKGLRTAPRDAMIAAVAEPRARGRAFGVHRALDTAGAMIGPLVAFAVLAAFPFGGGYPAVFVVATAFAVVGLAVLVLLVPDVRLRAASIRPVAGLDETPRPAFRALLTGPMRRLLACAGLLAVLTVGDGFLFLLLAERDDVAVQYFPLLIVGASAAYLLLAVPVGRLADRVGRSRVFVGGHVALVGAYLTVGGPVTGVAAIAGCLALLGLYYAATDGVLAALAAELAPPALRGSAIAAAQTVVALGRFASALLFGWLWTRIGWQLALAVFVPLLVVAIPVAAVSLRGLAGDGRDR